jgi:hypothetical protein
MMANVFVCMVFLFIYLFVLRLKIYAWARKASTCGFHLIPVPVDPFALPELIQSDPLRGPIFVPLNVSLDDHMFLGRFTVSQLRFQFLAIKNIKYSGYFSWMKKCKKTFAPVSDSQYCIPMLDCIILHPHCTTMAVYRDGVVIACTSGIRGETLQAQ